MSYCVRQFNHMSEQALDTNHADNKSFMTPVTSGTALTKLDTSMSNNIAKFYNECVKVDTGLKRDVSYYLHTKIKRLTTEQIYNVYLIDYNGNETKKQFLKKITISAGLPNTWTDNELVFTPVDDFDTIVFELQRTTKDIQEGARVPALIYQELSVVNNIILNKLGLNQNLLKIGLRANPGFLFCLNGEEMRCGKSGIYEFRHESIGILSLGVATAGVENIDEICEYIAANLGPVSNSTTNSRCLFQTAKERLIPDFTLDYMYKEA